jgi:uncharacterized membrane protein YphA (DoxX/SURF4 family)
MKVRTRPNLQELGGISSLFLRFALGLSFLAAVADRFGLWGPFGQPNVAWGDFSRFVDYTAKLNWFLPHAVIPTLAGIATLAEALLGLLLLTGWRLRIIAFVSGVLLLVFGLAMTFALGIKAPLNFSVFSAAGGGFLLAASSGRKRLRKDDNIEGEIMSDESKSPPSDQPPPSSKPPESDGSCAARALPKSSSHLTSFPRQNARLVLIARSACANAAGWQQDALPFPSRGRKIFVKRWPRKSGDKGVNRLHQQ